MGYGGLVKVVPTGCKMLLNTALLRQNRSCRGLVKVVPTGCKMLLNTALLRQNVVVMCLY